ncbi:MAG TPA: cytochrome P450 [Anaerolineae bacterium]|nr:cytochrome P450 [Anaerolineae bacterium]
MTTMTRPTPTLSTTPPTRNDRTLLLGDLPALNKDSFKFWSETGKIGPVVSLRFGPANMVFVTDADIAQHIFQTNNRNYLKEHNLVKVLETGGDTILFTAEKEEWMWRRRLMQPAFHRKQIATFCDVIVEETEALLAGWQDNTLVDVDAAMKHLTMMVIGKTMFNVDMAGDSAELKAAYGRFSEFIINRTRHLIKPPLWIPTKANRQFVAGQAVIQDALMTIIESRRHSAEPHNDLLDMLLAAKLEDTGHTFTAEQLILEMSQIVFAGHETTAITLTWLLYLLAEHPDVEAKVQAELERVLAGRTPQMADLSQLTYLNQVIDETLRLYPAAYVTSRESIEADQLGEYTIKSRTSVIVNIYGIHHDPRYWENPEQFDPARFSAEKRKTQHKAAFIPFLIGPRKCIGEPLSRVEMQLILATLLQRFRFQMVAGTVVEPDAFFVLQPKGGLSMIAQAR